MTTRGNNFTLQKPVVVTVNPTTLPPKRPRGRQRKPSSQASLLAHAEPMLWLTGGALVLCIAMIAGLILLIFYQGAGTFWPQPVLQINTSDGKTLMGEVTRDEPFVVDPELLQSLSPDSAQRAHQVIVESKGLARRRMLRTGNYELSGEHFHWVSDFNIKDQTKPHWAVVVERLSWGRFYGQPTTFTMDGNPVADTPEKTWELFLANHDQVRQRWHRRRGLETNDVGLINKNLEQARLNLNEALLSHGKDSAPFSAAQTQYHRVKEITDKEYARLRTQINALDAENDRYKIILVAADGQKKELPLAQIVRAYPANQLSLFDSTRIYCSRWWEFLTEDPREANSEGGVFPAIFGTIMMTLLMSMVAVPFGVLAALYMREYAKSGPLITIVRIAVNNLAGVPSIVFGVFGLGFFCYGVGHWIDAGPQSPMPQTNWLLLLALLTLTALTAIGTQWLAWSRPQPANTKARPILGWTIACLWLLTAALAVLVIATSPFFHGFFRAKLPSPTFGTGGILWASLTLSLLTLPVVIVATEEALAAVPRSMREGSYACGASKWQTIHRIVLPRAMPGITTGMILAMARGAGEVAPLMLVGAVKLAPELPFDSHFPFFHVQRSFMHLGFHVYDLGFQSQNSQAAKPMVFTTTLMLILLITLLNVAAIRLRSRLRRRFASAQF